MATMITPIFSLECGGLAAALLSIMLDQGQSGAKPPHSKEKLDAVN